jgi:thioredoxin-related protein
MQKALVILFSFYALSNFAQSNVVRCDQILQLEPYLMRANSREINQDSLKYDLEILGNCGKLDSVDRMLFNEAYLGMILVNSLNHDSETITYNDLLNEINLFKTSDSYPVAREQVIARMTIEHKQVDLKNFEEDKVILKQTGFSDEELMKLESFLRDHQSEKWDYKEAVYAYSDYIDLQASQAENVFKFRELTDYNTALSEAKKANKKCLIYFSGYACVNARKMEERVLFDPKVKAIFNEDYFCYIAYVDDKSKTEDGLTTVGKKNADLQSKNFHSVSQPYFYIVNEKGDIISSIGYTWNVNEFIAFLTN